MELQVTKLLELICPFLYQKWVTRAEELWTVRKLRNNSRCFQHIQYVRYVTEVTLQQSNSPSENMSESKKYYSDKRKLYVYKVGHSILQLAFALAASIIILALF